MNKLLSFNFFHSSFSQVHDSLRTIIRPSDTKTLFLSKKVIKLVEKSLRAESERKKLKYLRQAIKKGYNTPASIKAEKAHREQDHRSLIKRLNRFVNTYFKTSSYEKRSDELNSLIEGYLSILKELDPEKSASYYSRLAKLYYEVGKTNDAIKVIDQVLQSRNPLKPKRLRKLFFTKAAIHLENSQLNSANKAFELAKKHGLTLKKLRKHASLTDARTFRLLQAVAKRISSRKERLQFEEDGCAAIKEIFDALKNSAVNSLSKETKKTARRFLEYCTANTEYYQRIQSQIGQLKNKIKTMPKNNADREKLKEKLGVIDDIYDYIDGTRFLTIIDSAIEKGNEFEDLYKRKSEENNAFITQFLSHAQGIEKSHSMMIPKIRPYLCNMKDTEILDIIDSFQRNLKEAIQSIHAATHLSTGALYNSLYSLTVNFHKSLKRKLREKLKDTIQIGKKTSEKNRLQSRRIQEHGAKLLHSSIDILEPGLKKMHALVSEYLKNKAAQSPQELSSKFSFEELGAIENLGILASSRIQRLMNIATENEISPLQTVNEKIIEADKIHRNLNKEIEEHPTYETGDILLDDENRRASCNKEAAFNLKTIFRKIFSFDFRGIRQIILGIINHLSSRNLFDLRSFVNGKYIHASIAIKRAANSYVAIAEVTQNFRVGAISSKDSITNKVFRPNFKKIVTKEALSLISQEPQSSTAISEEQILEDITCHYRRLSEEMLEGNEDKWSSIKFAQEKAFKTLIPKLIQTKRGEETILSNKETSPSKRQLFCSEFVVRFTHNVFKMLEEEIRTKYNIGQEIKIFHEVFPEDLEFERTTPGHLRDIFRKYFDKVERPKIIDALFDLPKKSTHVKA